MNISSRLLDFFAPMDPAYYQRKYEEEAKAEAAVFSQLEFEELEADLNNQGEKFHALLALANRLRKECKGVDLELLKEYDAFVNGL